MDGEADLLLKGEKGVCCSPPSAPKPRAFSWALQEPPTQICSQTFPAVWDAEIDSSIHSVTKFFFFLRLQSLPDTVLCWVCSTEQGPLQGHQHPGVLGNHSGVCRPAPQELREWGLPGMRVMALGLPGEKGTSAMT